MHKGEICIEKHCPIICVMTQPPLHNGSFTLIEIMFRVVNLCDYSKCHEQLEILTLDQNLTYISPRERKWCFGMDTELAHI